MNWNRIWILFVIVAIGLVLSWQQVGQRTAAVLDTDLGMLRTESPCTPLLVPCAAVGGRYALVLGPVTGRGDRLALRPAGFALTTALDAALHDTAGGRTRTLPGAAATGQDYWVLDTSGLDAARDRFLRVHVEIAGRQWVAEFPLVR